MWSYLVSIFVVRDGAPEDDYFFAYIPDIGWCPCSATGDTAEEALANLEDSYQVICAYYKKIGRTIPAPTFPNIG